MTQLPFDNGTWPFRNDPTPPATQNANETQQTMDPVPEPMVQEPESAPVVASPAEEVQRVAKTVTKKNIKKTAKPKAKAKPVAKKKPKAKKPAKKVKKAAKMKKAKPSATKKRKAAKKTKAKPKAKAKKRRL